MKKFRFSLETLLELRQNQENLAYKALLEAQLVLTKSLSSLEELEKEKKDLEKEIQKEQMAPSSAATLADQYEFYRTIEKRIEYQKSLVREARQEMDNQRQALAIAIQKRKMMENLQEKKFSEWEYNLQEQERAFFDELATMRFLRNKRGI